MGAEDFRVVGSLVVESPVPARCSSGSLEIKLLTLVSRALRASMQAGLRSTFGGFRAVTEAQDVEGSSKDRDPSYLVHLC